MSASQPQITDFWETRITHLEDNNWRRWYESIRGILRARKLWETCEAPVTDKKSEDWDIRNEHAMALIRQNLSDENHDH
ncbi:MAG: hypothetical protein M1837_003584, partial [Sclerophora amabilis]